MSILGCNCRCRCTLVAIIASVILGVVAAFLQFAGVFTVTPVFLWVALGVAIVYLAVLALTLGRMGTAVQTGCLCPTVNTLLAGILGTVLFSLILLAVGVVATSILSAILVGFLAAFFALTVTATACYVRQRIGCSCS